MPLIKAYKIGDCVNLIDASKAIKGEKYICPYCGAKVHKDKSSEGLSYFACYEGETHTDPRCIHISKARIAHILEGFEPDRFFDRILTPDIPVAAAQNNAVEGGNNAVEAVNNAAEEENNAIPKEYVERPLTSMSQLWLEGYIDNLIYDDTMGGLPANDVVITKSFFHKSFGKDEFQGGRRVIQMYPSNPYHDSLSIVFSCRWSVREMFHYADIRLKFANEEDYNAQTNLLFVMEEQPNGTIKPKPKHTNVLLAGDWTKHKNSKMKAKRFECAFVSKNQIYICK